jgi:PKHD-type hydroxylase
MSDIVHNKLWWYENVIPRHLCDDIIKYALSKDIKHGLTGGMNYSELNIENLKILHKKRKSKVVWLDEVWIKNLVYPLILNANKDSKWNFNIDEFETMQFTIYEPGEYYGWHQDSRGAPDSDGKVRKLSLSLLLSDSCEYYGGSFDFDFRNLDPGKDSTYRLKEINTKGSAVVFPSFIWHRVCPVNKGTRYSLVLWSKGDTFK